MIGWILLDIILNIFPESYIKWAVLGTMLLGWGILAVPTGIISAEMTVQRSYKLVTTRTCPTCLKEGLDDDANFCKNCGVDLPPLARD